MAASYDKYIKSRLVGLAAQDRTKFSSVQEEIVHLLMARGAGYQFCFTPELYDGNKEPADQVWSLGKTVFLFYCTTKKRSANKAIAHNVDQARRWLALWARGQALTGHNATKAFDLSRADTEDIVVVSVTDVADDDCRFLDFHCQADAPNIYGVTLSFDALSYLLERGGSAADVVGLISEIRANGGQLSNQMVKSWVDHLVALGAARSAILGGFPDLAQVARAIKLVGSNKAGQANAGPLNLFDLGCVEISWLGHVTAHQAAIINAVGPGAVGPRVIAQALDTPSHYIVSVTGRTSTDLIEAMKPIHDSLPNARSAVVYCICCGGEYFPPIMVLDPVERLPNLDQKLARLKEMGALKT